MVAVPAQEMITSFASVHVVFDDTALDTFVTDDRMTLDFMQDGGAGHHQASGDGVEAVAMTQAVLDFRAVRQ